MFYTALGLSKLEVVTYIKYVTFTIINMILYTVPSKLCTCETCVCSFEFDIPQAPGRRSAITCGTSTGVYECPSADARDLGPSVHVLYSCRATVMAWRTCNMVVYMSHGCHMYMQLWTWSHGLQYGHGVMDMDKYKYMSCDVHGRVHVHVHVHICVHAMSTCACACTLLRSSAGPVCRGVYCNANGRFRWNSRVTAYAESTGLLEYGAV